jgi:hypothetical protein
VNALARPKFVGKRICPEWGERMCRRVAWVESPGPGGLLYYWECPDGACERTIPEIGQA